jgi:hypothetical protein
MHVHIERKGLTPLQLGRMLVFINDDFNRNFMRKVAGRDSAKWAKKSNKKLSDGKYSDAEKYVALSLRKRETVELRVFRGTIQPGHILRNVEFCDALVKFCAPASRSFTEAADHRELIKFVDVGRKEWPELNRWMVAQGWIKAPSRKPKPDAVAEDDVAAGDSVTPADLSPASPAVERQHTGHPVNHPITGDIDRDGRSVSIVQITPENGWHRLPVSDAILARRGDVALFDNRAEWCAGFIGRSTQSLMDSSIHSEVLVYRWSPPNVVGFEELNDLWHDNPNAFSEVDPNLPVMAGDGFMETDGTLAVASLSNEMSLRPRSHYANAGYGGRPAMRYTPIHE